MHNHSILSDRKHSHPSFMARISTSSSSFPRKWDVFLSFYGKDTRRNFISNLYFALDVAGIRTFRDDPALEKGQEISSSLISTIKETKIIVVVISENYARSSWCLGELIEIIDCMKTGEHEVIPVFYYVDPSDLLNQKGSFGEALVSLRKRYSNDIIEKWKSALTEIAQLAGYYIKKDANDGYVLKVIHVTCIEHAYNFIILDDFTKLSNVMTTIDKNESDTIPKIVGIISQLVYNKSVYLEQHLVGIDSAIEEIYQKLGME